MKKSNSAALYLCPLLLALAGLTGCATKGAKTVYARTLPAPTAGPVDWAVTSAPRTQPGKIMDPEAVTYAQVPSRILYLPGGQGIFGRTSPRQEVAYNLVPVDRIPEIQAEGTPQFEVKTEAQEGAKAAPNTFVTAFENNDGTTSRGTARRLGVMGQTETEKNRARALLNRQELLKWSPTVGWVGFIEETVIGKKVEAPKQEEIKPLDEPPHGKPPEPIEPITGPSIKLNPSDKTPPLENIPKEKKPDVDSSNKTPEKKGSGLDLILEEN